MRVDVLTLERPTWRGLLHTWAFVVTLPAAAVLIALSSDAVRRASAAIYVGTLLAMFGTSAAYHRLAHSYRARRIMQRFDHATIYLLIVGTYAPICLVALPPVWGVPLLSVVGGLGVLGVVVVLSGTRRLGWLGYVLYPLMGWVAVVATPALLDHMSFAQLALVGAGGVAYTAGFVILLSRRPDPWPRTFGYHEIWHALTILAALFHFGAVASVLGHGA